MKIPRKWQRVFTFCYVFVFLVQMTFSGLLSTIKYASAETEINIGTSACNELSSPTNPECVPAVCGDGVKAGAEECDGTDGVGAHQQCSASCTLINLPHCGDNIVNQLSEQCDDGNDRNSDGCKNDCTNNVCGDHSVWTGVEECDDENTVDGDGCSATCKVEILPVCGDGVVNQTSEQCDDHNTTNGDGCSATCQTEVPVCGDGIKNGNEQCDDGNNRNADGCKNDCTSNICGDGTVWTGVEECDDGNTVSHDDCSAICKIEPPINPGDIIINELMWMGSSSSTADEWLELKNTTNNTFDLSNCYLTKRSSGNDVMMIATSTFVGHSVGAQGYFLIANYNKTASQINIDPDIVNTSISLVDSALQIKLFCKSTLIDTADDGSGTPLAGSNSTIKKSMSRKATPGDGTLQDNWCTATTQVNWDAGATDLGTPGSLNDCCGGVMPTCGDGTVNQVSEQCDDGNQINTDGCTNSCLLPTCGDGVIWTGHELCDDDGQNGQACTPAYGGECSYCTNLCAPITLPGPYCGDGIKNGNEQCDGTAGVGLNQTCLANCTITGLPYCGDGIVNGSEQCDDGNTNNEDQCKNDCTLTECRFDLDVMLVMDRSGSMGYENPTKLLLAKNAAWDFLDNLDSTDQSGLVSFANTATLDQTLSHNHDATANALITLTPFGATNIGDAIAEANDELNSSRHNSAAAPIEILLTDGMANQPNGPGFGEWPADVTYALAKAAEATAHGIKIFTIGLGSDVNTAMLQQIASSTGGQYYFAPTGADLANIFSTIGYDACQYVPVCGNNILDTGYAGYKDEQCDLGANNGKPGFACNQDCTNYLPLCGDGIVNQTLEQCDDGNTNNTDSCLNTCQLPTCGDGYLWSGHETCDDNGNNGKVCTPAYGASCDYCSNSCTPVHLTGPFCGDNIKNGTEQCDGTDGVGAHQSCSATCTLNNIPYCGDGIKNGTEECDDGNQNNNDGCSNSCLSESATIKATKIVCPLESELPNWSGQISEINQTVIDNFLSAHPDCTKQTGWSFQWSYNAGVTNPGDNTGPASSPWHSFGPTDSNGLAQTQISLNGGSLWFREVMQPGYIPFTGSGGNNVSAEFYCHTDADNYDNFENISSVAADATYYCVGFNVAVSCGNGVVEQGEQCDDTNQDNTDGCLNTCQLPTCGDGYLWSGHETCDDNGNNGKVCTPAYGASCDYCSNSCTPVHLTGPFCGDNIKNGTEQCDGTDGVGAHQSCSAICTLNNIPYCGDGIKNGTEECDDGNTVDTDSCRNDCTTPGMCQDNLDIVLVMDRSGSMSYSSRCDWWQLKCVNSPSCTSYAWQLNTDYNVSQNWCNAKNQTAPHGSVWTKYDPVKIIAAKQVADDFVASMSVVDQSGLVSFATTATLDKQLSSNHTLTQSKINSLVAIGATDIGDAIKLATNELTSARINPSADQIMILLTDGRANKPAGPGVGEYAPDVAYALAKANEAASHGIKIFTIGLDSEINATMLQQIATLSGGKYYFAPTSNELDDIFAALKLGVCGNETNICGDGVKNGTEQCDGTDGVGAHQSCSANCTLTNLPYCGDGIKNGTEECDGTDGVGAGQTCSALCLLSSTLCRKNLDVTMVMDRSGSMGYDSPTRLSEAKIAANDFLGKLEAGDQSSLVSFATTAILDKQLSNNHTLTQTKVSSLVAVGATDIGDALKLANNELTSTRVNPAAEKIMILLTDGKANKPSGPGYGEYAADVAYALTQADVAATHGVKIFTIGLGSDINAAMLQQIASKTGGQYYFAPTAQDLDDIFAQLTTGVCQNITLLKAFTPLASVYSWLTAKAEYFV